MKSTACTNSSRIIRSHTVLVVVIFIVYTHLQCNKERREIGWNREDETRLDEEN